MIELTRDDIIREIMLALSKEVYSCEAWLSATDEYDDDFIEFSCLIRCRFDLEFEEYDEKWYELLECKTIDKILKFVCKYNGEFCIAEWGE